MIRVGQTSDIYTSVKDGKGEKGSKINDCASRNIT